MEASTLHSASDTLLIVDDEPLMTDLFEQYMTRRGFRVLTAATGREALAKIAAEGAAVRLVVLDLTMPDMSGMEIAQRLAERAPDLPVIIASGHEIDPSQGMPPNIVGAVKKPYQNRVLAEHIHEILKN